MSQSLDQYKNESRKVAGLAHRIDIIDGALASSEVKVGLGVVRSAAGAQKCRLPDATHVDFLGVVMRQQVIEKSGSVPVFPAGVDVPILTAGDIVVLVDQDVVVGDKVFLHHTANAEGEVVGAFRKDADTDAAVEIVGAKFIEGASAGGLAVVRLK